MNFQHTIESLLRVPFDVDARLGAVPRDNKVKGLFFPRLVEAIGTAWPEVQQTLKQPPRLGRYLPFNDYSAVDYGSLMIEAARRAHQGQPLSEGLRRVQRDAVVAFSESTSGRVALSLASGFDKALLTLPATQRMVLGLDVLRVTQLGPQEMMLEYDRYHGWLDCAELGVLEGLAGYYDVRITIDVALETYWKGTYRVSW